MSAAGNDFVLLDRRDAARTRLNAPRLARALCDRRGGVGADGLLLVDTGRPVPGLSYFNSDGSAAFCGNGTRAAALWLYRSGFTKGKRSFSFMSTAGTVEARVLPGGDRAAVRMPDPSGLRLGLRLMLLGKRLTVHFVDTGVPHAVVSVRGLARFDVAGVGRSLRRHPAFRPAGANADFITASPAGLALRTYERGVEGETLACGTGAVAAAVVAHALGAARPPVAVSTAGGAVLRVDFKGRGPSATDVWLEGPGRIVFTGEIEL